MCPQRIESNRFFCSFEAFSAFAERASSFSACAAPKETAEETAQRIALANQAQTALTRLLAKEEIVINYFKNVWNVQFYDDAMGNKGLVSLVQDAINQIVNENTPE